MKNIFYLQQVTILLFLCLIEIFSLQSFKSRTRSLQEVSVDYIELLYTGLFLPHAIFAHLHLQMNSPRFDFQVLFKEK